MIISFVNQKGGVGKTTCTYNVGYALSKLKEKEIKSKSVNFRTYPSVYKAFKKKCDEQGASISELFDYFLNEVVEGRWKIDKPFD